MQQKYAAAKLTPEEWKTFRLRFAGDTAAVITAARTRADDAMKFVVEGNPARKNRSCDYTAHTMAAEFATS
jgi:hypothetical protein